MDLIDNLMRSEAFSMDNADTGFLILGFGDPHGVEGGERGED